MPVAAFVLAFVFSPLAIPFGHVARDQIRSSGEQGGGLALAALIIGYLSVLAVARTVIMYVGSGM
jgi:hypothetical protein